MKLKIALLAPVLFSNIILAQNNKLEDRTLQEIETLVANSVEFLGQTESAILAAGRPASVIGGDKWEAEPINTYTKDSKDSSRSVKIATGCGEIWLLVSAKTGLVYSISFLPGRKTGVKGKDIMKHLDHKYRFDNSGDCIFQAKDLSYTGLSVRKGAILIVALKDDKKTVRFEN